MTETQTAPPDLAGFNPLNVSWLGSLLMSLVAVAIFFGIWQLAGSALGVPVWLFPKPSDFLARFFTDFPLLLSNAIATGETLLAGFLLGVAIAVPLALMIVSFGFLERGLFPLIVFLNIMPKTVIGPILIVWFGIGPVVSVVIVFLMSFFPVLVDAMSGFRAVDPRLYYITRSMGASPAQTFWQVRLPASLGHIFAGMKIGIVKAVEGVIIAEFIASSAGLGFLIMQASSSMDMTLMFSALVMAALVALVFNGALSVIEALALPWERDR